MPFSRRPTSRLPIESQTLIIWMWKDLNLRQVKLSETNVQEANWAVSWDDLDPMALILKQDLDMVKMYHHTKNEVSMSNASEVIAQTDKHTKTQAHRQTHTLQKHYLYRLPSSSLNSWCLIITIKHGYPKDPFHWNKLLSFSLKFKPWLQRIPDSLY